MFKITFTPQQLAMQEECGQSWFDMGNRSQCYVRGLVDKESSWAHNSERRGHANNRYLFTMI